MGRYFLLLLLAGCTASEASVSVAVAPAAASTAPAPAPVSVAPVAKAPDTRDPEDRWACADDPPCPLERFMESVLAPASKRRDFRAVEDNFRRLAAWAPPGYEGWRETALRGAVAAHSGDIEGVRAACGGCHDTHKGRYRREMRDRVLPGGRTL